MVIEPELRCVSLVTASLTEGRMALTSQISEYDSQWPCMFDAEKARLERVFQANGVEFHHVGSTGSEQD
jgi:GrpB-like predicted nucleotidyltransferase (UPF0157 family)